VEKTAESSTPASPLRVPLRIILIPLAPPLALVTWILLSGGQRAAYLRSPWIRTGMIALALGAAPLLLVIVAAAVGLWPDPDPNPVGLGLLFVGAGVLACLLALVGIVRVSAQR
jgi:hypothetical protein